MDGQIVDEQIVDCKISGLPSQPVEFGWLASGNGSKKSSICSDRKATQRALNARVSVTLAVGTSLCPYLSSGNLPMPLRVAYRRVLGRIV